MKRMIAVTLVVFGLLATLDAVPAHAAEIVGHVVESGDTLFGIARRHGVTVHQLASANGLTLNSWVYVGQRLTIPATSTGPIQTVGSAIYTVRPGDTLIGVALRHGINVSQLAGANGLRWNSWVYVGQRLVIPGRSGASVAVGPANTAFAGKWINVNLTTQTLTAYEGSTPVFTAVVSTGLPNTPTPVGQFRVWTKLRYDDMAGPGYYLTDVPFVMYFYRGYGLHGTYWHSNFGRPMSHGCVNLSTPDAGWVFNWGAVGTMVVTHY